MVGSGGCGVGATWWERVGGSGNERDRERVMLLGVCYESENGDDDEACGR
eukprot:ctg_798.g332